MKTSTAAVQREENSSAIIMGEISRCIDPSCNGWYVDSFLGKYWIKCLDPSHHNQGQKNGEKEEGNHPTTQLTTGCKNGLMPQPEAHSPRHSRRGIFNYDR
jgi:hypothetical protein